MYFLLWTCKYFKDSGDPWLQPGSRKSFNSIFLLTLWWMSQKLTHFDSGRAIVWLLSFDEVSHPRILSPNSSSFTSQCSTLALVCKGLQNSAEKSVLPFPFPMPKNFPFFHSIEFPQREKAIKVHNPHLDNITAALQNTAFTIKIISWMAPRNHISLISDKYDRCNQICNAQRHPISFQEITCLVALSISQA